MSLGPSIFTQVINSYLPEPHASLLNGILFGISLKTTKTFYQQLKITGLLHIVVLSGMNITLLSSVVAQATLFFGKQLSLLITILTIIFFILFVGIQAPIIRAGVMGILTLVAILTGRKAYALWFLFISLIPVYLLHIFFPKKITLLSSLLSYGATLGIILFGQSKQTKPKNQWEKLKNNIKKELRPSFAAQLFTVPIIFIFFKQISLIAPLSNLLVAPMIAPLMIFGFLTAILGKINYFLGLFPSYICYGILTYMIWIIEWLSKLPFAFIQL
jgi:competence protein ComEC